MNDTCGHRVAAMNVDGWGYVECEIEAGHPVDPGKRGDGHRFGRAVILDGGAFRSANVPSPSTECPGCGVDVVGCTEFIGRDGRRRWQQPVVTIDKGQQVGGLVHIEGGERCLKDATGL